MKKTPEQYIGCYIDYVLDDEQFNLFLKTVPYYRREGEELEHLRNNLCYESRIVGYENGKRKISNMFRDMPLYFTCSPDGLKPYTIERTEVKTFMK